MTFDVMFSGLERCPSNERANAMKTAAAIVLATSMLFGAGSGAASATGETAMTDHAHDFDFLVGKWRVHHRRLKERLANNHDWVEFDGTCTMWMTMNGHGTV